MNWLADYVRPRLKVFGARATETPDNLWVKCPSCSQMIYQKALEADLFLCPHCDHHLRMNAPQRLASLFDGGQYNELALPTTPTDPLKFKDTKRYIDRLKEHQAKNGRQDALMVGDGTVEGQPLVAAVMDFAFMGGSMGQAVGAGLLAAADLAVEKSLPLMIVSSSGGARMQEAILSLMQMPRSIIAVNRVRDAGLPYIVLLADPTTGGVTASFAMLGDIQLAEPGAIIGFAGARVIEETIREKLPEGFQRSEYLMEHGMVDMVVNRRNLRSTLARIIDLLMNKEPMAEVLQVEDHSQSMAAESDAEAIQEAEEVVTDQPEKTEQS